MISLLIDVWTSPCSLRGVLEVDLGEVCLLLSKKAEACFHVLQCHIGTALLLPLLVLTLGLWYAVALVRTGFMSKYSEVSYYLVINERRLV